MDHIYHGCITIGSRISYNLGHIGYAVVVGFTFDRKTRECYVVCWLEEEEWALTQVPDIETLQGPIELTLSDVHYISDYSKEELLTHEHSLVRDVGLQLYGTGG